MITPKTLSYMRTPSRFIGVGEIVSTRRHPDVRREATVTQSKKAATKPANHDKALMSEPRSKYIMNPTKAA